MEIIDIHTHPLFAGGYPDTPGFEKTPEEMAETMRVSMDRAGISMNGLLGRPHPFQNMEFVRRGNDYTRMMVRTLPQRLFGLCFINPSHPPSFVAEELDRCLRDPAFRGIKLELDVNCRDSRLDLVMSKAVEYDVPVLHHAWYMNLWQDPGNTWQAHRSEPHDVADLAKRHPRAKIIMAHMEGCGARGVLDVAERENVWIDTSAGQPFTGTLEFAVETIGSERILFGSDLFAPRSIASQLGRVLGTHLKEGDLANILHLNARKLFRLPANDHANSQSP